MSPSKRKTLKAFRPRRLWHYCLLILVSLIILFPLFWLLVSSFKTPAEYTAYPIKFLPARLNYYNYLSVLYYPPFTSALLRTFGLSVTTAAITCITSAMAGYAFARIGGKGSKPLFTVVLVLLILPSIVLLIPQFILYARLKMVDTYWPWYLAAFCATNPLYIFLYRQFFLGFPRELEEAAEMDGASPFQVFFQIFLPNSKPAVATILIFAFNAVWGDFIMPVMFLNDPSQLLGTSMAPGYFPPRYYPTFLAGTVIYILPMVIFFLLIQKNIQKGFLFTGLRS